MPGPNARGSIALVVSACAIAAAAFPSVARAESRRALLVGIDKYVPAPAQTGAKPPGAVASSSSSVSRSRGTWSNLDGAVNDVEEMQQILIARFGFDAADIHVLRNAEATRARVMTETTEWLGRGEPGDVRLFFYAGHGSQVKNSLSEEADKLDESIVPADANVGALDIRDKELAALFNQALDNRLIVTVIFDSCHSGSIARGLPRPTRFRFIAPDDRDAADPARPRPPETREALVLSAAQDYQLAAETHDEQDRPHGLFSWALLKTLRSMPVNQSAERMFLQIRALMQSGDVQQEPVLAATAERRAQPLLGVGTAGARGVVIAVQQVEPDGSVILQGGLAAGIRKDAELRRAGDSGGTPLRLRVADEPGLGRSRAVAVDGADTKRLEAGTLFEVVRWTAPSAPALRVWLGPTTFGIADVRRESAIVPSIAGDGVILIDDPTEATTGTNLLVWNGREWEMESQGAPPTPVGHQPARAALTPLLAGTAAGNRLMVAIPTPSEVASALGVGAGTDNDAIEIVPTPDRADYLLLGRLRRNALEYAWVRPLATTEQARTSPLPARTDWVPLDDADPTTTAGRLRQLALRLAAIRGWLQLDAPADSGQFPYHLAIRNTATGEVRTSGPTKDGESYDVVLVRDAAMGSQGFTRRFVYAFAIDSTGASTLLFPGSAAGAVENRLPAAIPENGELPKEIPLRSFKVSAPFGIDTFILLTSETQLADPAVLEGEAVRRAETRGASDPLSRLLAQKRAGTRGVSAPTPADWSIERLPILSVPKGAS
jgi:caspase domain-containing protein